MTDEHSSTSEFNGTTARQNAFKQLYNRWKALDRKDKEDVPLITLITGQNARAIREDILPQLRRALSLEKKGIDPFSLWDLTPEDMAKKISTTEDPFPIQEAKFKTLKELDDEMERVRGS